MRILQGIQAARPTFDANYYSPGDYIAKLIRIKNGASQKTGKEYIAFETEIVAVIDDSNGMAKDVGEQPTYMIQATNPNMFLGEVKRAFMGLGMEEEQITESFIMNCMSDLQPFEGMLVHVNCTLRQRKQAVTAFGAPPAPPSMPNADGVDLSRFWPTVRFQAPITPEYLKNELGAEDDMLTQLSAYVTNWFQTQGPKIQQAATPNAIYATPMGAGMAASPAQYGAPPQQPYAPPPQQGWPAAAPPPQQAPPAPSWPAAAPAAYLPPQTHAAPSMWPAAAPPPQAAPSPGPQPTVTKPAFRLRTK